MWLVSYSTITDNCGNFSQQKCNFTLGHHWPKGTNRIGASMFINYRNFVWRRKYCILYVWVYGLLFQGSVLKRNSQGKQHPLESTSLQPFLYSIAATSLRLRHFCECGISMSITTCHGSLPNGKVLQRLQGWNRSKAEDMGQQRAQHRFSIAGAGDFFSDLVVLVLYNKSFMVLLFILSLSFQFKIDVFFKVN